MYLQTLLLDSANARVRQDLTDVQACHRFVQSLFDGDRQSENTLWQLDPANRTVLVQADTPPNLPKLPSGYTPVHGGDVAPTPHGSSARFTGVVNPIKSVHRGAGVRGKKVAITNPDERVAWLRRKLDGAATLDTYTELSAAKVTGNRKGVTLTFLAVRFHSDLTITDPDAFHDLRRNGIGRSLAYGCGLLWTTP